MAQSVRALLAQAAVDPHDIAAIALSGHSLGCVPLAADGELLAETTPIWSDGRAGAEAAAFAASSTPQAGTAHRQRVPDAALYRLQGDVAAPARAGGILTRTLHLGTKDYINFRLTGRIVTDYSYASGSGVYDLLAGAMLRTDCGKRS